MKTTFYMVRHGQTMFNLRNWFQGWSDSPLTEEGIAQADLLHEGMKDIDFVFGASSTSERAMDTLHHIRPDLEVKYLKGLKEVFFGEKEATSNQDKPDPEQDWVGYAYCGGENRSDARIRFMNTLEEIAVEGNILIVSHAAVICRTVQYLDPTFPRGPSPSLLIPNCSVTIIDYEDGQFQVKEIASTKYRELD